MKIEIDIICDCGNSTVFEIIDAEDFIAGNSHQEFICSKCKTRIIVEKPKQLPQN